jgi:putative glutamine amidotransferase
MRLVSAMYGSWYPFDDFGLFNDTFATSDPDDLRAGDVLVVWGGADISPSLYNKPVSKFTSASNKPSRRDAIEWALMQRARDLGCPIIGVCRGGQMLTALAGGSLIQHVNHHAGANHMVTVPGDISFMVNSIHHQMMNPAGTVHELIAVSSEILSDVHIDVVDDVPVQVEPEFIYYPELKGFAIQWHPEGMHLTSPAQAYLKNFMQEKL